MQSQPTIVLLNKSRITMISSLLVFFLFFVISAESQIPIPQQKGALPVPNFIGHGAEPHLIQSSTIPSNPFMGSSGWSNTHNDSYMSDTYFTGGPLGVAPMKVSSSFLGSATDPVAVCVTMTFDSKGRIVTAAPGTIDVRLYLIDPETLKPLAKFDLPSRNSTGTDVSAGGYFCLDNNDRAIVPAGRQIWMISHDDSRFHLDQVYELKDFITENDRIASALPDYTGRLWFITKGGVIGSADLTHYPDSGSIAVMSLEGEIIANSFSLDESGGVYIATDHALYRFDAGSKGEPVVTWRETYDRGSQIKPGQFSMGTGTTPTVMGSEYVTITDNAEPQMHVLVYRRAKKVEGSRLVCSVPVFEPNRSATENSLIATGRSIIVENNYGYDTTTVTGGLTTERGITRIDLDDNGVSRVVWTSQEHVPSVVSKMSLANGLIYTYTKDAGPETTDAWYFTAIDFDSGQTVFKQLAGTGDGYNNHYAALYLGPDGKTAYVGVLGGIVSIRDNTESVSGCRLWTELDGVRDKR